MASPKSRYWQGVGRRKRASAYVRISKGKGKITINQEEVTADPIYLAPLKLLGLEKDFDINVKVKGGGVTSQKKAVQLGIARALVNKDIKLKPTLRKAGFLTRDPREKERKKPGLKRARRAPQWQKR